jgi:hypothetical protein
VTSVAVITSIYGGYDRLVSPEPQDLDCEWVVVTDRMPAMEGRHPWPWLVVCEPRPHLDPRLAAKVAKCRPDWYTSAEVTIWVDGHLRITDPGFVRWAVDSLAGRDLAQLPHPQRTSLLAEAALSAELPKYRTLPVADQAAHYLEGGYPDGWGLWATGLIVRRTTPQLQAFGDGWLAEQVRWTVQDQLSEAPVLWRLGIRPVDLDGPLVGHQRFDLARHADGTL